MKISFLFFGLIFSSAAIAQKQTFDLVTYVAPKGWKKEVKENVVIYSFVDQKDKSWCQVGIFKSTASKGSIEADFENEWMTLVENQYDAGKAPENNPVLASNGWEIKSGAGSFLFNQKETSVLLTTYSGYGACVSILATMADQRYMKLIKELIGTLSVKKPIAPDKNENVQTNEQSTIIANNGFTFTITNFDDGWTATEQPDWVKGTKGNAVVLIHYAQPDIRAFNNLDESTAFVWNTMIAPRYNSISNLWIRKSWWADGGFMDAKYFAEADLTENATGKKVHVALFRGGNGGKWIEIITPDKTSFQNQFTVVYPQDGTDWNKLIELANLNKFAVSAADLPGQWGGWSGAGVEYVNIYTGAGAGMGHSSSSNDFTFYHDGTYSNEYKGVSGSPGAANQYHGVKYSGQYMVTNWEMKMTNRFQGATETFAIQFEAIKDGRILHMYRGNIEELHLFKIKKP